MEMVFAPRIWWTGVWHSRLGFFICWEDERPALVVYAVFFGFRLGWDWVGDDIR